MNNPSATQSEDISTLSMDSNVILFPGSHRINSGFHVTESQMRSIHSPNVIKLTENIWYQLREMLEIHERGQGGQTGWEITAGKK